MNILQEAITFMQKFIILLTKEEFKYIENPDFECFILSETLSADFKKNFALKAKDKIVLAQNLKDMTDFNLDGVVLDFSMVQNISFEWKKIKPQVSGKITGLITRNRRHEAMLTSECEPDFIIFKAWCDGIDKIKELTSWYQEMFLIQSALWPQENLNTQDFETEFVILFDEMM